MIFYLISESVQKLYGFQFSEEWTPFLAFLSAVEMIVVAITIVGIGFGITFGDD